MKNYGIVAFSCIFTVVGLFGCASSPELKAVLSSKETIRIEDKVQNAKTAWIGKYLLEPNARNRAVEILSEQELPREWGATDYTTLASMTTDLALGQLGSTQGELLGTAAFAIGLLAGDGSKDLVSGMFLPQKLNEVELTTPEQARDAALKMVTAKIHQVANDTGYSVSCIYECNGYSPIFRFDLSADIEYTMECFYSCGDKDAKYNLKTQPFEGEFEYQPTPFTLIVHIAEFEDAGDTRALDSLAAGFLVKWKTKGVNGAMVEMRDKISVNAERIVEVIPATEHRSGIATVNGWNSHINTPFGRSIYRTIFDNKYHYFGSSASSIFVYNLNTYYVTVNSVYNSLDRIITN